MCPETKGRRPVRADYKAARGTVSKNPCNAQHIHAGMSIQTLELLPCCHYETWAGYEAPEIRQAPQTVTVIMPHRYVSLVQQSLPIRSKRSWFLHRPVHELRCPSVQCSAAPTGAASRTPGPRPRSRTVHGSRRQSVIGTSAVKPRCEATGR